MEQRNLQTKIKRLFSLANISLIGKPLKIRPVEGSCGTNWRLTVTGFDYLVRHATPEKKLLGVKTLKEYRVLKKFCAKQLAPRPFAYSGDWLLCEWINGNTLQPDIWLQASGRQKIADLVSTLHQQPLMGYQLDIKHLFNCYWQQLDKRRITVKWLKQHHWFNRQALPISLQLVPAHMDIHLGNIIENQGVMQLIDWEYACDTDLFLELAAIFLGNQLTATQQEEFLNDYGASKYHSYTQLQRAITKWYPWIKYLAFMWYEVRWQQTKDQTYLQYSELAWQKLQ